MPTLGRRAFLAGMAAVFGAPHAAAGRGDTRPTRVGFQTETLTFPPSAVTTQQKIDWLSTQVDEIAHAVDAEADRPLPLQRDGVYLDVLARGAELLRLIETIAGSPTRLKARIDETMTKAHAGLERIANAQLEIGMTPEQVRAIRGEPSRISVVTTPNGVREQWHYGMTVLSFADGRLVEIFLMLKGNG